MNYAIAMCSVVTLATVGVSTGQEAPGQNAAGWGVEFVERPGEMEFSGQMIARPLQYDALREQGMSHRQAMLVHEDAGARLSDWVIKYVEIMDEYILQVPADSNENEMAAQLMATGDYQYVHPNWIVYPIECPDDPRFGNQWQHENMVSCVGWDLHTGNPSVSVGICDTGVRTTHLDLENYRLEGYNAVSGKWENDGGQINDINGHGTACTGCAAAEGNNGIGIAGMGWQLSHRMLRVTNDSGGGAYMSHLTHAALTSVAKGDKVASVSYSGVQSETVETTGATIMDSYGGLLVWAAGNESTRWDSSDWEHVIIVGATDSNDNKAGFSNYGLFIDVMAPGDNVYTTLYSGDDAYGGVSGTSFSCPITAGLCAMLYSANPALGPYEVMNALYEGCDSMGSPELYGWGRVNLLGSLSLVVDAEFDRYTIMASVDENGVQGNDESVSSSISSDGGFVAYQSSASNLVDDDTNGVADIFVYNVATGAVERVSLSTGGDEADGDCSWPAISGDGSIVVFLSEATNLVDDDTNGLIDVFAHDRNTGETVRLSVDSDGDESNGTSSIPAISDDGRFVAFHSNASNLVQSDGNGTFDIFVVDRQTGLVEIVSVDEFGHEGDGPSYHAALSADGQFVAYESEATNLVGSDSNGAADVFVFDRSTGEIERVSLDSEDRQGNDASRKPGLSADGRYVAFESDASNLVEDDVNGYTDIFLRDRVTGEITLESVSASEEQGTGHSQAPQLSDDARYVVFESRAANLVMSDTNGRKDIFLRDRVKTTTERLSVSTSGRQGNGHSCCLAVSGDGEYVAFTSEADSLADSDSNDTWDVFLRWDNRAYRLKVDDLVAGSDASFDVKFGTPYEMQYLVYSLRGLGSRYVPPLNVTIDLDRPALADQAEADKYGSTDWDIFIPNEGDGRGVWFQVIEQDHKTEVVYRLISEPL